MATTVYEVQELVLQDGSTVTCKPANIKVMRKGQELLSKLGDAENNDDGINKLLDIVALCTKRERPEFEIEVFIDPEDEDKGKKKVTNYDLMTDLFDMDTVFKVIELYLGIKLNDPKMLEAAAQMALLQEQEKAGTN